MTLWLDFLMTETPPCRPCNSPPLSTSASRTARPGASRRRPSSRTSGWWTGSLPSAGAAGVPFGRAIRSASWSGAAGVSWCITAVGSVRGGIGRSTSVFASEGANRMAADETVYKRVLWLGRWVEIKSNVSTVHHANVLSPEMEIQSRRIRCCCQAVRKRDWLPPLAALVEIQSRGAGNAVRAFRWGRSNGRLQPGVGSNGR